MPPMRLTMWLIIASALLSPMPGPARATEDPFPHYAIIDSNVSFWKAIYAHYSTTQAVVHDSLHLNIVYDVIDLVPTDQPNAQATNRRRMKQARKRMVKILTRLAADPLSTDGDCRRVAALFGSEADAGTFQRACYRVRCQIGQRERFREGLIRSGAYIDEIRAILRFYDLPEALAYLPHVESSFDTHATSKAGAAGMWQFTRSTGRRFLTVDQVVDERRDPISATYAAARLLKENYAKLGSWPMAITAYNHGTMGMLRAQAAHGDYPSIITFYTSRTFKFASRNFYAEFLAARQVASDSTSYFGPLSVATPLRVRSVYLDGFVAAADICRTFAVSPQHLRALNPALQPPVLSGHQYIPKGYFLNLPFPDESPPMALAENLASMFKSAQRPTRFYTVRQGDTAFKIARMHRVDLDDLILANKLDRRATIYARQTIRIPHPAKSPSFPSDALHALSSDPGVRVAAAESDDPSVFMSMPTKDTVLKNRHDAPAEGTLPDA